MCLCFMFSPAEVFAFHCLSLGCVWLLLCTMNILYEKTGKVGFIQWLVLYDILVDRR